MKLPRSTQPYLRRLEGFVYLVAIMNWLSRYVLSWRISISLEANFCVEALHEALESGTLEVFNTDQGSQFTSSAFAKCLVDAKAAISMDGHGRVFNNIFIERLWRSVKYEEVYLYDTKPCRTLNGECNVISRSTTLRDLISLLIIALLRKFILINP